MATSTVPAVKDYLLAAWGALPALAGVQLTWGLPKSDQNECILIGGAEGRQKAASLGARRRDESYDLTVIVSAVRNDGVQRTATVRAFALMAVLEDFLRDDPTLGGLVRSAEVGENFRLQEPADGTLREGLIEFSIAVEARI